MNWSVNQGDEYAHIAIRRNCCSWISGPHRARVRYAGRKDGSVVSSKAGVVPVYHRRYYGARRHYRPRYVYRSYDYDDSYPVVRSYRYGGYGGVRITEDMAPATDTVVDMAVATDTAVGRASDSASVAFKSNH